MCTSKYDHLHPLLQGHSCLLIIKICLMDRNCGTVKYMTFDAMNLRNQTCRCNSLIQLLALAKLSLLVMSNTMTAAAAPLQGSQNKMIGLNSMPHQNAPFDATNSFCCAQASGQNALLTIHPGQQDSSKCANRLQNQAATACATPLGYL